MNLWQDELPRFVPAAYAIKRAELGFELLGHHRLRREFFCDEQRLFEADDRDEIDRIAIPIVAVSCTLGDVDEVLGTVRIHEASEGTWWGSRLCVARGLRGAARLGAALIRTAVATANAEGCDRFLAHVQAQNLKLFLDLGWTVRESLLLHGHPHLRMEADLARFPTSLLAAPLHLVPPSASAGRHATVA